MQVGRKVVEDLLAGTGVEIDGSRPWDIRVRDDRFYGRVLKDGSLGLGEAYMEGWWDCDQIDEFICRILRGKLQEKIRANIRTILFYIVARLCNLQSLSRAGIIARKHYDLGNELFFSFLDSRNQYSCGYFENTDDLEEAQEKKLELICRKLDLQPDDRLLDIGCGWGGLARYAAEQYGCSVTAVNISEEQIRHAREICKGLPVEVVATDYRRISGHYDKIVSVGMFEHVGRKNYREFMDVVSRSLNDDGVFLLHTIGGNLSRVNCDPWINRYIFPNGMLPSIAQIGKAAEGRFVVEDLHNMGPHYEKTLLCWYDRFQCARDRLPEKYDDVFKRMWEYYFLSCAGAFRARHIQVWQIAMTKTGAKQTPLLRA
ncbi:MAG: cyclopropane-fatty-acyl-phospholipid synthase [delta proteobacterium MLS_D]|jgi:cyclopropane-fatty-acyl-phospholipid synthase|nr:MAG: cyclopropane-fatty-acyl-phospholipid synthase [delta proteobacterium MLS_D]